MGKMMGPKFIREFSKLVIGKIKSSNKEDRIEEISEDEVKELWDKVKNGYVVTYICNGNQYQETVSEGEDILHPTSFTPVKSGTTFLGWSNSINSTVVLANATMLDEPITLYAVWKYEDAVIHNTMDSFSLGGYDRSRTYKTIDGSKYSGFTANVSVSKFGVINATTGQSTASAYLNGIELRSFYTDNSLDEDIKEHTGTPCYNGARANIKSSGNVTFTVNDRIPGDDLAGFYIYTITAHGKTIVG